MPQILVLYGTTERHTEKIATAIAETLIANGCVADLAEAGTRDPTPVHYSGVIVAASLHAGHYQKAVATWLDAHRSELASKPTAFVSVCLATASKRAGAAAEVDAIISRFLAQVGWQPTVIKPVAGALLYTQYGFITRWIMRRIARKEGGDTDTSRDFVYTDWQDVRGFAEAFSRRVAAAA
jgi:menaquinone-dependent protoporphyrinogen oxidase